jgi:hypothetical protein
MGKPKRPEQSGATAGAGLRGLVERIRRVAEQEGCSEVLDLLHLVSGKVKSGAYIVTSNILSDHHYQILQRHVEWASLVTDMHLEQVSADLQLELMLLNERFQDR